MADLESVSDSDLEEKELDEEKEEVEISDDVALLTFTNVLQRVQEIAVEAEQKKFKSGQQKWKTCYKGNSDHNLCCFQQKHHQLKSSGQKFISKWFPIQDKTPWETLRETLESVGDSIFWCKNKWLTKQKPPFVDLQEEDKESEESEAESEPEPEFTQPEPEFTEQTAPGITEDQCIQVQVLLNELWEGHCPQWVMNPWNQALTSHWIY